MGKEGGDGGKKCGINFLSIDIPYVLSVDFFLNSSLHFSLTDMQKRI